MEKVYFLLAVALLFLASFAKSTVVRYIVDRGRSENMQGRVSSPPLHYSAKMGGIRLLKRILYHPLLNRY